MTPIKGLPVSYFIVSSHSDTGLGHVTFFGPQDVSKYAAGVSLKSVCAFLLASLHGWACSLSHLCHAMSMTRLAAGGTWEACGENWAFLADWPAEQIQEWVPPRSTKPALTGKNTQSTHRLTRSNKWYCFKPLGFGVGCYMQQLADVPSKLTHH